MAFSKPTKLPEWASGGTADVVEPTAGEKSLGWVAGQTPPAPYMNWLMGADFGYFPWLQYVSTFEQQALTWPERQTFQKGFAASGVRSTIAGLDVTGGATVAGGLGVDSIAATGAVSGTTASFSGALSAGSFAELELTSAYGSTEIATALGGLTVSGNGMVDPASISSSNAGSSFAIIKTANGDSSPMKVAASFDVPTGALITTVSATVTNGAASIVTLTCSAYLRTAAAVRTQIVNQGATINVPASAANYTAAFNSINTPSVWNSRTVPATKGTRVEVVIDTGLLPSGFAFTFLAISVTYSQTKPRP